MHSLCCVSDGESSSTGIRFDANDKWYWYARLVTGRPWLALAIVLVCGSPLTAMCYKFSVTTDANAIHPRNTVRAQMMSVVELRTLSHWDRPGKHVIIVYLNQFVMLDNCESRCCDVDPNQCGWLRS